MRGLRLRERAFEVVGARVRRLCRALGGEGGFTLTEALATVIIVGLVSAGFATAATVGADQFSRSMAASESQALCSSLQRELENDLAYTTSVTTRTGSDIVTGYMSLHHSDESSPLLLKALDENGEPVAPTGDLDVTGYGQLALCSENDKVKKRLLGSGAYNYGLKACVRQLSYDADKQLYTVTLVIKSDASSAKPLSERTFSVKALNMQAGN